MFENLRLLYKEYGGIRAALRSGYFWSAVALTLLSLSGAATSEWTNVTTAVLPSITGFTIAAFALVFSVLSPDQVRLLAPRDEDGRSPLLGVVSALTHAVVVQASALLLASVVKLADFSFLSSFGGCVGSIIAELELLSWISWISDFMSVVGIFLTVYGLLLVLAAVLSIFRIATLVWGAIKK